MMTEPITAGPRMLSGSACGAFAAGLLGWLGAALLVSAAAPPTPMPAMTLTNLYQFHRLAEPGQRMGCAVRLEGTVLWVSAARDQVVLKDGSSAAAVELDARDWPVQTADHVILEGTGMVRDSRLFLDVQTRRRVVTGTNALPLPRQIVIGPPLKPDDDCQWSEVEGEVIFAGEKAGAWELEMSSLSGRLSVIIPNPAGISPCLLLHSRIRATGCCQAIRKPDGRIVAGWLLVPGPSYVRILTSAPEHWSRYPVVALADLVRAPAAEETGTLVHLRGQVAALNPDGSLQLRDGPVEVRVEPWQPSPPSPSGAIEVLGTWSRAGTNGSLRGAVYRPDESQAGAAAASPPPLTTVAQIHALPREQAARRFPVLIRGVVTCVAAPPDTGMIQDATRGIYVPHLAPTGAERAQVGDYLEVAGFTSPGDFAPIIDPQRVTRLGKARMPEPTRASWDQLMNGSLDMQYIEIEGLVTATQPHGVTLLMRGGRLQLSLEGGHFPSLARYQNARVHLRGCFSAKWDAATHQITSGEVTLHDPIIEVDQWAPPDLFAIRRKQTAELMQFDAWAGALERVRIAGQIVHGRAGEYFLMDGTNGLRFFPHRNTRPPLGERVEVVGFPWLNGPAPVLREAVVRQHGPAPLPAARRLTPETLLRGANDATLVAVEARLLSLRSQPPDQVLELQTGLRTFAARLDAREGRSLALPIGSRLRVIGVYAGQGGDRAEGRDIDAFELLVNAPADVTVLELPPWWDTPRTRWAAALLFGGLLLAGAWIWMISRKNRLLESAQTALREAHDELEVRVMERTAELAGTNTVLQLEVAERKQAQAQLEATSRQAGMAEVATSVLHNVGNVLNSVNTAITVIEGQARVSQAPDVLRVAELLEQHRGELAEFLTRDHRADKIVTYLRTLAQHLASRQSALLAEVMDLTKNVDHIKDIVAMQQGYARTVGMTEPVVVVDLVNDALAMHTRALLQHDVQVVREFDPRVPGITVEKHKLLQILVNLIGNAKHACDESERADKRVTLRVTSDSERVFISVSDNGIGISTDNLTRIFQHGFTTRLHGHGFGLHSAALAAREMKGALRAHSDGPGQGARFILELPHEPEGSP